MEQSLTIVIPTLDAAARLGGTLAACAEGKAEIVVVDGGSRDATVAIALAAGARVVHAAPGRGGQIAAGIAAAHGGWLLVLHADTRLAPGWAGVVRAFMADPANAARAGHGRFTLDDPAPQARALERAVAWRCRWLGLPYGDQGLLFARGLHDAIGGYRTLPLMEDVDLVRRLGRRRLVPIEVAAVTSAERWRREGWRWRSTRNLLCLGLWWVGVPAGLIRRLYG